MANPLLNGFNIQDAGNRIQNGIPNLKEFLQDSKVKQQVKQLYALFQGNPNSIIQSLLQNNPAVKKNPMLGMLLQGGGNPNDFLKQFGLTQNDFVKIING